MAKTFKEGICPRCHEKIQVPDDRERILCMYCGEEIFVEDALGRRGKADPGEYGRNRAAALQGLADIITRCKNPMKDFRKGLYEEDMERYSSTNRRTFEAAEYVYQYTQDRPGWIREMTGHFLKAAKADMEGYRPKARRSQRQLDLNFLLCAYLVPALLKYPAEVSDPLADSLVETWNEAFGTAVGKATFEEINGGFRKKLCYITTAVCESLGKGPGCRELTLLKEYRDHYLMRTAEGRALTEAYYDIAPTIVRRINKEKDKDAVYQKLYRQYLLPCIQKIERQEYEACCVLYQEMVESLEDRYVYNR